VIDLLGLNDYVIARTRVPPQEMRHMAHERRPPPGYIECFRPDFELALNFPDPPEVRRTGARTAAPSRIRRSSSARALPRGAGHR